MKVKALSSVVRPLVTLGLVIAFIAGAFQTDDPATVLGPPAALVLGWWFKERADKNGS